MLADFLRQVVERLSVSPLLWDTLSEAPDARRGGSQRCSHCGQKTAALAHYSLADLGPGSLPTPQTRKLDVLKVPPGTSVKQEPAE